jgi:hypothetical protein
VRQKVRAEGLQSMGRSSLSLEKTSRLVARFMGATVEELMASCKVANEEDLPEILKIRRTVFNIQNQDKDEQYLRWRYRFGDTEANGLWVVKRREEVLGVIGLEFGKLHLGESEVNIVRTMDIMVRPEIDGYGLGAWMNLYILDRYPLVYVTGGNEKSTHLLKKLFFPMAPINTFAYLNKADTVLAHRFPHQPFLKGFLMPPLNKVVSLRNLWLRPKIPKEVRFSETTFFDPRFDALCESAAEWGWCFVGRDAASLNWRFIHNPCEYEVVSCCYGDTLIGYSVLRFGSDADTGVKTGLIVDWLAGAVSDYAGGGVESGGKKGFGLTDVLSWIFYDAVVRMVERGCETIHVSAWDDVSQKALRKVGFVLRPRTTSGLYLRARDPGLHERLTKTRQWLVTGFDSDTV